MLSPSVLPHTLLSKPLAAFPKGYGLGLNPNIRPHDYFRPRHMRSDVGVLVRASRSAAGITEALPDSLLKTEECVRQHTSAPFLGRSLFLHQIASRVKAVHMETIRRLPGVLRGETAVHEHSASSLLVTTQLSSHCQGRWRSGRAGVVSEACCVVTC